MQELISALYGSPFPYPIEVNPRLHKCIAKVCHRNGKVTRLVLSNDLMMATNSEAIHDILTHELTHIRNIELHGEDGSGHTPQFFKLHEELWGKPTTRYYDSEKLGVDWKYKLICECGYKYGKNRLTKIIKYGIIGRVKCPHCEAVMKELAK